MSRRDTVVSRAAGPPPMDGAGAPAGVAREVVALSPGYGQPVDCVVCLPAFRRPAHLRLTLASLAGQTTQRRFAIVIVENDAAGRDSAAEAADFLASARQPGLCVVEPNQGNCHAINAAFETARAAFPQARRFLMIDDDEVAAPDWLEQMASAADTTGADIVGGPVVPDFAGESTSRLGRHPAFRPAYDRSGPVPVIYGSGNCLITRRAFERLADPSFDLRFNYLGGGDTDFFARCRASGLSFFWNADAVIRETVPTTRTRPGWLVRRGLRIGAINYHVQWKIARGLLARTRLAAKMALLLPVSFVRAAALLASGQSTLIVCHPIIVALGSALASVGIEPQQYKAKS